MQVGAYGYYGSAVISGGSIINNNMDGSGVTNKAFGGGGIYVNGMPPKWYGVPWTSGKLYLTNALISENEAALQGAGYASCPISETHINVDHGAAIYGNKSPYAQDIYILSSQSYGVHSGTPSYDISDRMLGGSPYLWKDDEGKLFDKSKLKGTLTVSGENISLHTDEKPGDAALRLASVIIKGNVSATRGGGIGSNGVVYIGENKTLKDLEILKVWEPSLVPEEIEIELRAKIGELDWLLEKVKLNSDNNFKYVFEGLPSQIFGNNTEDIIYVKENASSKYSAKISKIVEISASDTHRSYRIVVENRRHGMTFMSPAKTSLTVNKIWEGVDAKLMPPIRVFLMKNGVKTDSFIELNSDNGWAGSFTGLPHTDTLQSPPNVYAVWEEGENNSEIVINGNKFKVLYDKGNITNTLDRSEEIEITVNKLWVDRNNAGGLRPASVHVKLYADGNFVAESDIKASEGWSYSFKKLPKYNTEGKEIIYTITEDKVKGYTAEIRGFTITNKENAVPSFRSPQTGDSTNIGLYSLALLISGVFLIFAALKVFRKKTKKQ